MTIIRSLLANIWLISSSWQGVLAETSVFRESKRLTMETLNPNLRKMEYAVRGPVVIEADRISDQLRLETSRSSYPFDHIIYTNIGNPHSVGQVPLTWPRQVSALVDLPDAVGLDHPACATIFPADAIARAREVKAGLRHGTGAYSHSKGVPMFRRDVADFIERRDGGLAADPEMIFLTNGASSGIGMILGALIAKPSSGVMIPIPQYPIYSATIDLLNGRKVGYYMDEDKDWALNLHELERALEEATADGTEVNSFVLINPGNPTGQVLSRENLHDIIRFCVKYNLVLLADEVYQENVYDGGQFVSAKLAAAELGLLDQIELVSFHSVSKGVFGECGRRGGYMELVGIDPDIVNEIYKLASSSLCSTVSGQLMVSLMVRGPASGDESYESHEAEKAAIFQSLQRRSQVVSRGLDQIRGFSCRPARGSMYCFPQVEMPPGAIRVAAERSTTPDALYCVSLLQATGICVVPASGFGQRPGRFGFRTTFLPNEDEMRAAVDKIAQHYEEFCRQYAE